VGGGSKFAASSRPFAIEEERRLSPMAAIAPLKISALTSAPRKGWRSRLLEVVADLQHMAG